MGARSERPRKILPGRIQKFLMLDTGYWYAVCPWPCLYETLRTRFVRNAAAVGRFKRLVAGPNTTLLDDTPYREPALDRVIEAALRRPMSLVDTVTRAMIEDVNVKVDCFLTFSERDFFDVCQRRGIPMRYGVE
jgi:hypothetical protein